MWKEFQLTFSVRDATVLHARSGKIFMDSSRESGLVVLIHELLGEAEGDKHTPARAFVFQFHESWAAIRALLWDSRNKPIRWLLIRRSFSSGQSAATSTAGLLNRATLSTAGPAARLDSRWCVFLQGEEMQLSVRLGVAGGAGLSLGVSRFAPEWSAASLFEGMPTVATHPCTAMGADGPLVRPLRTPRSRSVQAHVLPQPLQTSACIASP